MGVVRMNMSQGTIERDEPATIEYSDEIMCCGCNPAVSLSPLAPEMRRSTFPVTLAEADVEQFIKNMYG